MFSAAPCHCKRRLKASSAPQSRSLCSVSDSTRPQNPSAPIAIRRTGASWDPEMSVQPFGFAIRNNGTCGDDLEECGDKTDPFHACCPSGSFCDKEDYNADVRSEANTALPGPPVEVTLVLKSISASLVLPGEG